MKNFQLDPQLQQLSQHKQLWLQQSLPQRIALLRKILTNLSMVAPDWVKTACLAKGLDSNTPIAGEEGLAGPFGVMHYIRLMIRSLEQLSQGISLSYDRPGVVNVFPSNLFDRLLWLGTRAEVWCESEHATLRNPMFAAHTGEVALVLGAGNIAAIAPMDVLHQLFIENRVVMLKLNPVNEYLEPYLQKAFAPLQKQGFFQLTRGGAEVGQYLCHHPEVDTIHITGSHHTYDAIVWGAAPEMQQAQKAAATAILSKSMTAELGGVTPILVVPGQWSKGDLKFQARHVASMVVHNASFNCVAGKVLLLAERWPQRDEFLALLRQELTIAPPRKAYYPGAFQRYQHFLSRYPQAEVLGQTLEGCIPWTLIPNIPPSSNEYALQTEAFCGILAVVCLPAATATDFLQTAVPFVNDSVFGTLSCTILMDKRSQQQNQSSFQQAIAQLRYGSIGVNIWSGALFLMPEIPWGAFPGNRPDQIGSGCGFVHNTALLDKPQKAVVYAPFRIWPTPCWFKDHRTLNKVAAKLIDFEEKPEWQRLLAVIAAAIGG